MDEKINQAALISGSNGSLNISHSNIYVCAGDNIPTNGNDEDSRVFEETAHRIDGYGKAPNFAAPLDVLTAKLSLQDVPQNEQTCLQPGKFVMFHNRPVVEGTKVFLGKQILPGNERTIAVKRIEYCPRSLTELNALTKLRHPNIISLIDAGEFNVMGHWIYLVMEFCPQNLQQYIEKMKNPLSYEEFESIFYQILVGLEYLQKNGILHLDIKPDNVLIDKEGYPRLSDFGICKILQIGRAEATLSNVGIGSDAYRSPEMYKNGVKITGAADIFSLALVATFIVTRGQHAFGSDPFDWRDNIRKNKGLDLSIVPHFDGPHAKKRDELINLLHSMLHPDPKHRPSIEEIKSHNCFQRMKRRSELPIPLEKVIRESSPQKADSQAEIPDNKEKGNHQSYEELKVKLNTLLMNAGRNLLKTNPNSDMENVIRPVKDFVCSSPQFTVEKIKTMSTDLTEKESHIYALILMLVIYDMSPTKRLSPDDAAKWLKDYLLDVKNTAEPLMKANGTKRKIGIDLGFKRMEKLLNDLRLLQNVSAEVKALTVSRCLVCFSYLSSTLSFNDTSAIQYCEEGIAILETQFGSDASKYRSYARLQNNLGCTYSRMGDLQNANKCFSIAVDVHRRATDYNDPEDRKRELNTSKENLEKTNFFRKFKN